MTPAEFYEMLKETAEQQGFKPGWIYYKFRDEYGRAPTREEKGEPAPDPLNYYLECEAEALKRGYKRGWAYFRFVEEFGRAPTPEEKGEDNNYDSQTDRDNGEGPCEEFPGCENYDDVPF